MKHEFPCVRAVGVGTGTRRNRFQLDRGREHWKKPLELGEGHLRDKLKTNGNSQESTRVTLAQTPSNGGYRP